MPKFNHQPLADNETFLGTWTDNESGRSFDLYFRPKPSSTDNGFVDAIVARWSDRSYDFRTGIGDTLALEELDAHWEDVERAVRIGRLIAEDSGLVKSDEDQ